MSITPTDTALLGLVMDAIELRLPTGAMTALEARNLRPLHAPGLIGGAFDALLLGGRSEDGTCAAYLGRVGILTADLVSWRVRAEALSGNVEEGWGILVDHECPSLAAACDLVAALSAPGVAKRVEDGDWLGTQHLTPVAA